MNRQINIRSFFIILSFLLISVPRFLNITLIKVPYQSVFFILGGILVVISFLLSAKKTNVSYTLLSFLLIIIFYNLYKSNILGESYMQDTVIVISLIYFYVLTPPIIEKILKLSFYLYTLLFIIIITLSLRGILNDNIIDGVRHSLGFINPNGLGLIAFVISLIYIYINKEKIYFSYFLTTIFMTTVFFITKSRTVMLSYLCATLVYIIINYLNSNKYKFFYFLPMIIMVGGSLIFYFYKDNEIWNIINTILSGRPRNSKLFFDAYDFSWFGQPILNTLPYKTLGSNWIDYYVLDSSYLRIYFQFGFIVYTIFIVFISKVMVDLYKSKEFLEYSVILSILIYAVFDRAALNVVLMPILFLLVRPANINKKVVLK